MTTLDIDRRPVTADEVAEAVVVALKALIEGPAIAVRFTALEQQIATLQTRALKDGGIWRVGVSYTPGGVVTAKGSAWVCLKAHESCDPFAHGSWRLLLKGAKP
ncbi:MAG TPA: hypothetical protein VKB50_24870 [Vicinamibacterales bacterium]|nr:hypothetical protein [Vicinamibacterales bacterium]